MRGVRGEVWIGGVYIEPHLEFQPRSRVVVRAPRARDEPLFVCGCAPGLCGKEGRSLSPTFAGAGAGGGGVDLR